MTAATIIYTLSLHDALPISDPPRYPAWPWAGGGLSWGRWSRWRCRRSRAPTSTTPAVCTRSEEHTSELQSHVNLVCRLLLEKKKNISMRLLPYYAINERDSD